jgi:molybdopterin/thiamine biosynthesis adenylyltransferase
MKDHQLLRYSRHILLPEIEYEGQQKLLKSHCLIVGAGGLGSPAAMYLAASGIGKITICDFDKVDLSNLQRQILHTQDLIGVNKAQSAKHALNKINSEIQIIPIEQKLSIEEMSGHAKNADVIVDCSDNFDTRYGLNQIAFEHKKPLISGAAIKFDGQVSVFDFRRLNSPCYHCLFPNTAEEQELNCADHGIFSPLVGIVGACQAGETIKVLLGIGQSLAGRLLLIDYKEMQWKILRISKDKNCSVCSAR